MRMKNKDTTSVWRNAGLKVIGRGLFLQQIIFLQQNKFEK